MKPERLPDDELRTLAIEIVEDRVFITRSESDVHNAFGMVLAFLDPAALEDADNWGSLYEDYEKALPRTINGVPVFSSFKVLHADDLEPLQAHLVAYQETAINVKTSFVNGGGT